MWYGKKNKIILGSVVSAAHVGFILFAVWFVCLCALAAHMIAKNDICITEVHTCMQWKILIANGWCHILIYVNFSNQRHLYGEFFFQYKSNIQDKTEEKPCSHKHMLTGLNVRCFRIFYLLSTIAVGANEICICFHVPFQIHFNWNPIFNGLGVTTAIQQQQIRPEQRENERINGEGQKVNKKVFFCPCVCVCVNFFVFQLIHGWCQSPYITRVCGENHKIHMWIHNPNE